MPFLRLYIHKLEYFLFKNIEMHLTVDFQISSLFPLVDFIIRYSHLHIACLCFLRIFVDCFDVCCFPGGWKFQILCLWSHSFNRGNLSGFFQHHCLTATLVNSRGYGSRWDLAQSQVRSKYFSVQMVFYQLWVSGMKIQCGRFTPG